MSDTLAAMLEEVNAAGYFFNNLFQLQDGSWRCNLRSEVMVPSWSQFGNGADPVSAVAETLAKLQAEKPKFRPTPPSGEIDIDLPDFLRRYRKELPETINKTDLIGSAADTTSDDDLVG